MWSFAYRVNKKSELFFANCRKLKKRDANGETSWAKYGISNHVMNWVNCYTPMSGHLLGQGQVCPWTDKTALIVACLRPAPFLLMPAYYLLNSPTPTRVSQVLQYLLLVTWMKLLKSIKLILRRVLNNCSFQETWCMEYILVTIMHMNRLLWLSIPQHFAPLPFKKQL